MVRDGRHGEWITETFAEPYLRGLPEADGIYDLIPATEGAYPLPVAECPTYGRRHV